MMLVFQRAEALAKKWDLLQVKEKEEKYTRLLQRLELQHKLIAKRDLLSKQLEREATEKHVKVNTSTTHNKSIHVHLYNSTGIAVLPRFQEANDAGSQRPQQKRCPYISSAIICQICLHMIMKTYSQ